MEDGDAGGGVVLMNGSYGVSWTSEQNEMVSDAGHWLEGVCSTCSVAAAFCGLTSCLV
jgi:hypothetical protein